MQNDHKQEDMIKKDNLKHIDPSFVELVLPQNFIVQPNKITMATMPYNRRQMDSLILVLDRMQYAMVEQLKKKITVEQLDIFQKHNPNMLEFEIPIVDFGVSAKKYKDLKDDLKKMSVIPVNFHMVDKGTGEHGELAGGFYTVWLPEKYGRSIKIKMDRDIASHLVDIQSGFTRYNRPLALSFKSAYAKRLYMFISSWKHKGGTVISMEKFRQMMNVVNKYERFSDLSCKVIKPCYEILKEKADCWFEVSPQYRNGEKHPYQLVFKIISIPLNDTERKNLEANKKFIEGMLFRLGVKQGHIEQILNQIYKSNVIDTIQKVDDLLRTDFDRKIIKPDSYYFKIINDFVSKKI